MRLLIYPERLSASQRNLNKQGHSLPLAGSVLGTLVGGSSGVQAVLLPRQQGVVTLRRISSVWTKSWTALQDVQVKLDSNVSLACSSEPRWIKKKVVNAGVSYS